MKRLIAFGGLSLLDDDGSTTLPFRPQRLALLAVLAEAAPRGVTRERLVGLFWPDSEEEDARHSLRQALYALRVELGRDPVLTTGADLRLDLGALTADVAEFHSALASGDRLRAADLFSGPFLDGFYLANAAEFERWVEDERGQLASQATALLEELAREAETAGDRDSAVTRRRQLARLDPLSGRHALAYLKALRDRGDRADALAFARTHEALVRRELNADPDPKVQELVRQLRAMVGMPVETKAGPPTRPDRRAEVVSPPEATALAPAAPPGGTRRRIIAVVGASAILLAIAALALTRAGRRADTARVLAVGLIAESGVPDSLRIGGVLTDMLATNLGRVEGLSVLANSRVLETMEPGQDTSAAGYARAARQVGATELIEGRLRPGPAAGFALELSRVDLRRGLVRKVYRVFAVDRYALVDSATAALVRDLRLATPAGSVAEATTQSPIAYRFYEEGQRAYFQADARGAYRLLRSALEEDPDFALAAYYASLSAVEAAPDSVEPLLRRAQTLAARSPAPVRYLIAARYAWLMQDARAVAAAETLSVLVPDDPEAQRVVGTIRSYNGDYPRSVAAYERAIALDSATMGSTRTACRLCSSLFDLASSYWMWDSLAAEERTLRRWIGLRPGDPNAWSSLAPFLERAGRWEEARLAWRRADSLGAATNREVSIIGMIMQGLYDEAERALSSMLLSPRPEARNNARWFLLIVLRNRGRLREAVEVQARANSGGGVVPAMDTLHSDPINQAILAFETGRFRDAAERFAAQSRSASADRFPGRRARNISWWLALSATASAAAGDTSRVRALADTIARVATQSLYVRDRRLPFFLRGLLAAREGRHAEAVDLLRQGAASWTYGYTRVNYELARSLLAVDRPQEAVAVLQSALRGGLEGSNLYLTRTELHELLAQAWDRAGQPDSSAAHYLAVARAWSRADPPFQPRLAAARAWLTRHGKVVPGGG